jgi:hypothetical protein
MFLITGFSVSTSLFLLDLLNFSFWITCSSATRINVTIDDTLGDSLTRVVPNYSGNWTSSANPKCTSIYDSQLCWAHVPAEYCRNETYHQSYSPKDKTSDFPSVDIDFFGEPCFRTEIQISVVHVAYE